MVRFELRDVAGGWEQARFGPTDQVDYALYESTTPRARDFDGPGSDGPSSDSPDSDGRGFDSPGSDSPGSDTETPALRSYDSVHTFLRLYDLARLERTTHPEFLGARLRETGERVGPGDELLELAVHGTSVRTTYSELRGALRSFFEVLFPALDRETPGERPDLETFEVAVTDLDRLYAEVVD